MDEYPPVFERLYSVSDIHMGGTATAERSFQIFNKGERLGRFVRRIARQKPKERVCLVLNGDVIDSLAEDDVGYVALSEDTARRMMKRIFRDDAFRPVWDGLAAYVQTPRRTLVVIGGNHDIELGLPVVEHLIRERLAGGDTAADQRIVFSGRGSGYACRVGNARVFCTHGNEGDPANRIDHEKLGQLARAQNAGRAVSQGDWTPNLGTRLVVDIMNDIKRDLPFVDLLKPTTASIAAVLLTLKTDALQHLAPGDAARLYKSYRRSKKVGGDLLSVAPDQPDVPDDSDADVIELLGPSLRQYLGAGGDGAATEEDMLLSEEPDDVFAAGAEDEVLGWRLDVARGMLPFANEKEALRRALEDWVNEEKGPDELEEDDWLSNAFKERHPNANFVVTGHTHRARAIAIEEGSKYYLNSGTWIQIFRLTKAAVEKKNFDAVWDALHAGSIEALADLRIGEESMMVDYTTAVHIAPHGSGTRGEILKVTDKPVPEPVPSSQCDVGVAQ